MFLTVEGCEIRISNPDKLLFPDLSLTKWDYALAMARLAPYLIPYCRNRLLTTIRYPDGVNGDFFYQKNVPQPHPSWIQTKKVGEVEYILLNNVPTLIWLANLACLEFHVSFDLATHLEYPTELVFDLDPNTPSFHKVIEVAFHIRETLQSLGLDGVVKTSGASGLQVYVPIEPKYTFDETRIVSRFLAQYLEERYPRLVTLVRRVQDRGEKVYIDYLQHWHNKTLIAPYSPRARDEGTLSTPLQWDELKTNPSPTDFHLGNIMERLQTMGDLFQPIVIGPRYELHDILRGLKSHIDSV